MVEGTSGRGVFPVGAPDPDVGGGGRKSPPEVGNREE